MADRAGQAVQHGLRIFMGVRMPVRVRVRMIVLVLMLMFVFMIVVVRMRDAVFVQIFVAVFFSQWKSPLMGIVR